MAEIHIEALTAQARLLQDPAEVGALVRTQATATLENLGKIFATSYLVLRPPEDTTARELQRKFSEGIALVSLLEIEGRQSIWERFATSLKLDDDYLSSNQYKYIRSLAPPAKANSVLRTIHGMKEKPVGSSGPLLFYLTIDAGRINAGTNPRAYTYPAYIFIRSTNILFPDDQLVEDWGNWMKNRQTWEEIPSGTFINLKDVIRIQSRWTPSKPPESVRELSLLMRGIELAAEVSITEDEDEEKPFSLFDENEEDYEDEIDPLSSKDLELRERQARRRAGPKQKDYS